MSICVQRIRWIRFTGDNVTSYIPKDGSVVPICDANNKKKEKVKEQEEFGTK